MAADHPNDRVAIVRKGSEPSVVSRRSFERVWKSKGYKLQDTVESAEATPTSTTGSRKQTGSS